MYIYKHTHTGHQHLDPEVTCYVKITLSERILTFQFMLSKNELSRACPVVLPPHGPKTQHKWQILLTGTCIIIKIDPDLNVWPSMAAEHWHFSIHIYFGTFYPLLKTKHVICILLHGHFLSLKGGGDIFFHWLFFADQVYFTTFRKL